MRRSLVLTLILLVSAWAIAQQDMQRPSAPAGQNQTQTQQPGSAPGQASPGSPSTMAPMGGADMIEGCLGGSNPNYTVTDKAGTTYQLDIPKGADASVLAKHIGESVQVQGSVESHSIHVARIGKGSSSCPGSSSTTPKPPSK